MGRADLGSSWLDLLLHPAVPWHPPVPETLQLVKAWWWPSLPSMQFLGRMVSWKLSAVGANSSVIPVPFTFFLKEICFICTFWNIPEIQPCPGLQQGSLKSKGDGGKRERPLTHPSESIYGQSAAMCSLIWAQWEINQPQQRSLLPKPHHFWCLGYITSYWLACLCNSLQVAMGHT